MKVDELFNNFLRKSWFNIFFFLFCGLILFSKSDRIFGWTNSKARTDYPIMSDGSGYYAYLPQWYTYNTSKFEFSHYIEKKYPKRRFTEFAGIPASEGIHYNKYYPGSALCLTPFYWTAELHCTISGHQSDGYSWPFLFWCNVGVIFFTLFGAFGLFRFLKLLRLSDLASYLAVVLVIFGTNLCFYTTVQIPFSHPFSFFAVSWVLVFAKKWIESKQRKHLVLMAVMLGLALIIRPTNLFVVLFLPFLFDSNRLFAARLIEMFKEHKKDLFYAFLGGSIFIGILLWNNYQQTGEFKMKSYPNENFDNWKNPYVWDVLFSYKKGFFTFAPLFFLLFPALIFSFFRARRIFWGVLIIFSLVTYSTAAWWMWWFGGGLGARNYIDFMPILILPIALMFDQLNKSLKLVLLTCLAFGIYVYQIFDYQMRNSILHYDDMPKDKFWDVFLKTDDRYKWYMLIPFDTMPDNATFISSKLFLRDWNGRNVKQEVELKRDFIPDDPTLIYSITNSENKDKMGIQFDTDIKLHNPECNPMVHMTLFRKGQIIESRTTQFGGKIPEIEEYVKIRLYHNFDSRIQTVDSIKIWFDQSNGNVSVKNQYVQFYGY